MPQYQAGARIVSENTNAANAPTRGKRPGRSRRACIAVTAGADAAPGTPATLHLEHARLLRGRGAVAPALLHFEQVIARHPADADLHNAFGRFLQEIGEHGRAIEVLREAVALAPDHPGYRFNLGLSLLARGALAEGWPLYADGRRMRRADPMRRYPAPEWRGEPLAGKTLYLWDEQGIGDTLLYGAMIPDLQARGAHCILECEPRLVGLFQRSLPELEVVAAGPFANVGASGRRFDFHAPLGSIGRFVRPTLADFPPPRPFLKPDRVRLAAMREALGGFGAQATIGLSWHSASTTYADKSIPLIEWAPILNQPGRRFVALQYGDIGADVRAVRERFDVDLIALPDLDRTRDIDGVAALAAACDVVVTISNVTANIAGALGVPTLLLIGPGSLWYWFEQRADSPFYANMRLIRAPRPNDWRPALAEAAELLAAVG
jgi:hypothetical protein